MLRWPQVVRWIQWGGEAQALNANDAYQKAEAFEKLIEDAASYDDWRKTWEAKELVQLERTAQLYELLRAREDESERIVHALQLGVW